MTEATAPAGATIFRPAVVQAAADLVSLRQRIAAQHAAGAPGIQTGVLASDLCDDVVIGLWNEVLKDLPPTVSALLRRHAASATRRNTPRAAGCAAAAGRRAAACARGGRDRGG